MATWQPAPIVGGAYADDTRPWSSQDTVNWLPLRAERPGGRADWILRSVPGFGAAFGNTGTNSAIRGARNVEGNYFCVAGQQLFKMSLAGVCTSLGTIPGTGRVSMTHNQITDGNELVIGTGPSGYVYNTKTAALTQITDVSFPGFKICDYVDSYIAGVEPLGRYWFTSDLAAATVYLSTDRYEAEAAPDLMVSLIVSHREVLVFGDRTIEPFRNTGATSATFERVDGATIEVGCAATHSLARLDNSVFWLANDGTVRRLDGYTPVRISTQPLEQAIAQLDWSQAFAQVFEDRGHKVYYLTFPDGQTWGYDIASQEWARRKSYGMTRWRMNTLTYWNGKWICGDYDNGKLYQLDWNVMTEDGAEISAERITGVASNEENRVNVLGLKLLFDMGRAAEAATDHFAELRYSDDGGHNWTNWRTKSIGAVGEYQAQAKFLRLGSTRSRVYHVRVSSPAKRDLIAASIMAQPCE